MESLEAVLFDMMIVYLGKIVMDVFDLFSDMMAYFTAVNGQVGIPMWFNIMYVLIVGMSIVVCVVGVYYNLKLAAAAFFVRTEVVNGDVTDEQMMKIRARSSIWMGNNT